MASQPEMAVSFPDVFTHRPLAVSVQLGSKQLCVDGRPVGKLAVTGQSWGVQLDYACPGCPFQSAGFGWDGHRERLQQLGAMVSLTNVRHNMWAEYLPPAPLFSRTVTVNAGGRLCLGAWMIERVVWAQYGSESSGYQDVLEIIERAVMNGGVKGLTIDDGTMGTSCGSIDAEEGKVLRVAFLTTACPKPPPKNPRRTSSTGPSAGSRGSSDPGSRGSMSRGSAPLHAPYGAMVAPPAPHLPGFSDPSSRGSNPVTSHDPYNASYSASCGYSCDDSINSSTLNPALTGNADIYLAYIRLGGAEGRIGLYLAYHHYAPNTKVVVTAQSNSTTIGTVTKITRVQDMADCGDIVESVVGRA